MVRQKAVEEGKILTFSVINGFRCGCKLFWHRRKSSKNVGQDWQGPLQAHQAIDARQTRKTNGAIFC